MTNNNLIFIDNVTKAYHSKMQKPNSVIKGLTLEMYHGERIGITGPSGCGKTTLLKLIAGLEKIDRGRIVIREMIVSDNNFNLPPHRRKLGYVFQTPALWPHMTVKENVGYPAKDKNIDIIELLDLFEVSDLATRFPSQISGGQAKRVSIARALASGAELLLMDEPLTNLEKDLKESILITLDDYLNKTKTGLIYVTHDEKELSSIVSKSYKITNGVLKDA